MWGGDLQDNEGEAEGRGVEQEMSMSGKIVAITWIGTYYCPWFPYTIASAHSIVDLHVIVNMGFDLKNPSLKEYEVPLEEVSRDIDELDVEGKILEVTDFSRLRHKYPLVTQKLANQLKLNDWYDIRGYAATLASDIAYDEGAKMVMRIDSDTVLYKDASALKGRTDALNLYQNEFQGDIQHLADPGPDSPYNDSVHYYPIHEGDWYMGAGTPLIRADRKPCPDIHCAHLRYANPLDLSEEEKFQHFRGRAIFRLFTNDYGEFTDELFIRADNDARSALKRVGKPSDVPPPEACLVDRRKLREYIEETL